MATKTKASHPIDDDYIDMEIISCYSSSSNSFFSCSSSSTSSPPHNGTTTKEFEFQMSSIPNQERETLTFPADELFYKGKLLPLHLPPRLQMVQNITKLEEHQEETEEEEEEELEEETFTIPFKLMTRSASTAPCTNTTNTPLDQSCNISPSESCRVSCELNPDEFLSHWSTEVRVFINGGPNTTTRSKYKLYSSSSWSTKLMKQFSLGRNKLKASRAYLNLKSLFNKSSCNTNSDQPTCNADQQDFSSNKNPSGRLMSGKGKYHQISTTLMKTIENEIIAEANMAANGTHQHRKSFSGVIQRHISSGSSSTSTSSSGSSSSSSSFSLSSSNGGCGFFDHLQQLKRSSSASSELESSVEGAIAHCKQSNSSNQFHSSRKSTTSQDGAGFSLSKIAV